MNVKYRYTKNFIKSYLNNINKKEKDLCFIEAHAKTSIIYIQGGPEFIVQTLRVGTGYCNNHLLYRNVWAQVTRWGASKEKNRRKERQSFIESVVDKSNVYNNCSKLCPPVAIHVWQRRWSDCCTHSKMPSISRTRAADSDTRVTRY